MIAPPSQRKNGSEHRGERDEVDSDDKHKATHHLQRQPRLAWRLSGIDQHVNRLFAERGFSGTTVASIAERARLRETGSRLHREQAVGRERYRSSNTLTAEMVWWVPTN